MDAPELVCTILIIGASPAHLVSPVDVVFVSKAQEPIPRCVAVSRETPSPTPGPAVDPLEVRRRDVSAAQSVSLTSQAAQESRSERACATDHTRATTEEQRSGRSWTRTTDLILIRDAL